MKIVVTDQDVADYYQANRVQFNVVETQYRIAQILVTARKEPHISNRKNNDATTETKARLKSELLVERLRSNGFCSTRNGLFPRLQHDKLWG